MAIRERESTIRFRGLAYTNRKYGMVNKLPLDPVKKQKLSSEKGSERESKARSC